MARRMLLVSVSTDPENARATLELRREHPEQVRFFAGIHPSEVGTEARLGDMEDLWEGADGVGEIGLDPKYSQIGKGTPQADAFLRQLEAAEKHSKPVEVHSRGAVKECLGHLSTFRTPSVLMHWFDDEAHLQDTASKGYYVSFGPSVIYSKRLRRMASSYPPDLTLVESDGPVPYKPLGEVGGSFLIPSVLFALAELRGTDPRALGEEVLVNTLRFLLER